MTYQDAMAALETNGTAKTRTTYARHGAREPMYGVSYAVVRQLGKDCGVDHPLAVQLWASGNHDARVLATLVADPDAMTDEELDAWAQDLDSYVITDMFAQLAARSPLRQRKQEQWTTTTGEWIRSAGWLLIAHAAMDLDGEESDRYFEVFLNTAEKQIATAENRVRHYMNNAVIAIGMRNDNLRRAATATAKRIGEVDVDHGATTCKTPDAVDYIRRGWENRK